MKSKIVFMQQFARCLTNLGISALNRLPLLDSDQNMFVIHVNLTKQDAYDTYRHSR